MQSFQSQVLDQTAEGPRPFELMLSAEEQRRLAALFPLGLSLSNAGKALRGSTKKPLAASLSTELDFGHNEKRQAYKQALSKISNSNDYVTRGSELLAAVRRHPKSAPFLQPVDPVAEGVPDYPSVIKEPMDLATVQRKLLAKEYGGFEEFDADMQRMFDNALLYNKPGTFVNKIAEELKAFYEKISAEKSNSGPQSHKKGGKAARGYDAERLKQRQKQLPLSAQPLSFTEQQRLSDQIRHQLPNIYLKDVLKIVAQEQDTTNEWVDLEFDKLSPKVARELQAYVSQKISVTLKRQKNRGGSSTAPATRAEPEPEGAGAAPVPQPLQPAPRPATGQNYLEESSSSSLLDSISDDSI